MTIDQAIKHCDEVSEKHQSTKDCADEHKLLSMWLRELKELRESHKEIEFLREKISKAQQEISRFNSNDQNCPFFHIEAIEEIILEEQDDGIISNMEDNAQ